MMPQVCRVSRVKAVLVAAAVAGATLTAQTVVTPPKNKYTPEQDVQLGREAAAEVRREYPIISDPQIAGYLERAGMRWSRCPRANSTTRCSSIRSRRST